MSALYATGKPSVLEIVANRIRYRSRIRALANSPSLDNTQLGIVDDLRRDGCAILPELISASTLGSHKSDLQRALEELKFTDTPYLDHSKIDPSRHPPLEKIMLLPPGEYRKMGLAIDKDNFHNYQQVINNYTERKRWYPNPGTWAMPYSSRHPKR
jgi:hypothetical protein